MGPAPWAGVGVRCAAVIASDAVGMGGRVCFQTGSGAGARADPTPAVSQGAWFCSSAPAACRDAGKALCRGARDLSVDLALVCPLAT